MSRASRSSVMKVRPAHGRQPNVDLPASRATASRGADRGSVSSLTAKPEPVDNFQTGCRQLPQTAAFAVLPKSDMEPRPTFFLSCVYFLPRPAPDPNPAPTPLKGVVGRGSRLFFREPRPTFWGGVGRGGRGVAFIPYCPVL